MIIDLNAWLGSWPFRSLRDNTPETLVARLDRCGIDQAAVSSVEGILHRNVQPANERLAADVAPFADRLIPMATINPMYVKWEDDLARCHESLGMKGVRLFPNYHGYKVNSQEARRVVSACAERNLAVFIPQRIEDHRQRHWMDSAADPLSLSEIAALISEVPDATVVITNARGLSRSPLMRADLRGGSWYVDLSLAEVHYVLHHSAERMTELARFIEDGGADHLVFGTHLPFSYAGAAMVKRRVLPVDDEALEAISHRRALKILGMQ